MPEWEALHGEKRVPVRYVFQKYVVLEFRDKAFKMKTDMQSTKNIEPGKPSLFGRFYPTRFLIVCRTKSGNNPERISLNHAQRQSPPPLVSGWSCVEGSVVSVRSVVCAQFVFDNFLQTLAVFLAELDSFFALTKSAGGGQVSQCSVQR